MHLIFVSICTTTHAMGTITPKPSSLEEESAVIYLFEESDKHIHEPYQPHMATGICDLENMERQLKNITDFNCKYKIPLPEYVVVSYSTPLRLFLTVFDLHFTEGPTRWLRLLQFCIEQGADVYEGLKEAIRLSCCPAATIFLQNGADKNTEFAGQTAITIAIEKRDVDLLRAALSPEVAQSTRRATLIKPEITHFFLKSELPDLSGRDVRARMLNYLDWTDTVYKECARNEELSEIATLRLLCPIDFIHRLHDKTETFRAQLEAIADEKLAGGANAEEEEEGEARS